MRAQMLLVVAIVGLALGWASPAWGEVNEVVVKNSTIAGVAQEAEGTLDMTDAKALVYRTGGKSVPMTYATMSSFKYSNRLARHLGVLPAIGVGMVRKRERKHYFTFAWKDDAGTAQVLELEVPKQAPRTLLEVLRARAPEACGKSTSSLGCGVDTSTDE